MMPDLPAYLCEFLKSLDSLRVPALGRAALRRRPHARQETLHGLVAIGTTEDVKNNTIICYWNLTTLPKEMTNKL